MAKRTSIKKSEIKSKVMTLAVLAAIIVLLMLLADHPDFIEHYYSKGLYILICHILHPLLNIFPFSVGDVLYIIVIIYLAYNLWRIIRLLLKKQFKPIAILVMKLAIGVESGIIIFYIFWGMNYFRPSAAERLDLPNRAYTTETLKHITAILIDSANATRKRVTANDFAQGNAAIYKTAIAAVNKLSQASVHFNTYKPGIKPSIITPLLNYLGTSGYYNPFTGEAQINYEVPVFERPLIACHEMSHQMGYGAEDEANFVGFLAGIGSNDRLLRYSSYQLAVGEFMRALRFRDSLASKSLRPRISPAVISDFKTERKYWLTYQSKIDVISGFFYDKFLKVNNQPQGLDTYNKMVLLVMAMYRRDHGL